MDFKRFIKIIEKSKQYEDEIKDVIKEFNYKVKIEGYVPKLIKEIGKQLDVLVIEIPIKNHEFGAVFFNSGYSKYLILNSSQPRCKMYFSFCHDIYHVLRGATDYINECREVHLNSDYLYDENECKANLFAANILMPENEFKDKYNLFSEKDSDNNETIVLKLMDYFNSPFIAVVIRLFELRLLDTMEDIKGLLDLSDVEIKQRLCDIGISDEILDPTLNDEMNYIFKKMEIQGKELIGKDLLDENRYNKIMERLKKFYEEIRVDG